LPTVPVHLMSLGKVSVTRLGSGAGPMGSLTVTPTLGSVWAMAAKPAAPAAGRDNGGQGILDGCTHGFLPVGL